MTLTPDRRVRRSWLVLAVVVVLAAGYFYATAERRQPVEIVNAEELDEVLLVVVGTCGGEPTVSELDQGDAEVRIVVESTTQLLAGAGGDCQDGVEVHLDAPFGDRVLIDGSNGQAVEVQQF